MSAVEKLTDRRRNLIFINVVISCCAASILQTALNTALASISRDLSITSTTAQWLVSGYSLAMGIVMPLTAFMIRRIKTKRLYLFGLLLFIIGLVIDIIAPNFIILLIGRVFQGCGNGILISMTQVVILSIFPPSRQGTAMGWYGLAVSAMPAIAPTLGGVLVETISWRAIFALALIVLVVALIMALKVFDNVLDTAPTKLDMISFILSVLAFGGLTLGLGNLATYGITNPSVYISLIVGVVAMIIFVRRQLGSKDPFLDFRILKTRAVVLGVIGSMVLYFILMGSSVLMPLYVQNIKGGTAIMAGLVTLPGSVAMAIISPFSGRIYDKMGIKNLFVVGSAMMLVSSLLMGFLRVNQSLVLPSIYNVIRCVAIGLMLMPLITWGTTSAGKAHMADASAMLSSLRTIGGAIGTAVFVGISTAVANRVGGIVSGSGETASATAQMRGMNIAYLVMAGTSAAMLLIGIFLVKSRKQEAAEAAAAAAAESPSEAALDEYNEEVVEAVEESKMMKAMEISEEGPEPEAVEFLERQAEEEIEEEALEEEKLAEEAQAAEEGAEEKKTE